MKEAVPDSEPQSGCLGGVLHAWKALCQQINGTVNDRCRTADDRLLTLPVTSNEKFAGETSGGHILPSRTKVPPAPLSRIGSRALLSVQ